MSNPILPARLNPVMPDPQENAVENQLPNPVQNVLPNPNQSRFAIDRTIGFEDRGKIPQIVRDLPDFTGNPRDLSQWILDVEDVLELFDDLKNSFQYYLLIKTIRRKIKGEANDALITSNAPTQWDSIKEVLKLYYADKRDLMTLDNQLKSLSRHKVESLENYYSRVRELITLISSAITMDDQWRGHEMILMRLYNQIALDTFIRGLGDPLSRFCKNFKPHSLAQAYSYCVDYLNLDARNAPVNIPSWQPIPTAAPRHFMAPNPSGKPPVPPRQHTAQINPLRMPPNPLPRRFPTQNFTQQAPARPNVFAPNRTFFPQQPRPEPMDSSTIRTQQVNYGNRPIAQRRGPSDSMRAHDPTAKRVAHTVEEYLDPAEYEKWYEEQLELSKEFFNDGEELNELENLTIDEQSEDNTSNTKEEANFLEDTEWVSKWFE